MLLPSAPFRAASHLRGSTVVDGDAFGKFDGVGESDLRNGLRLEGGQWVK